MGSPYTRAKLGIGRHAPCCALVHGDSPYTRAKLGIGRHAPCCALVHGDSHPRHRIFRGR